MVIYVWWNNYTITCKERHYISGWFFFTFINMDFQFMGLLLQTPWICTNCVFQVCKTFCSSWKQRKIPRLHLHYTSQSHGRPWGTLTNFTFGEGRGGGAGVTSGPVGMCVRSARTHTSARHHKIVPGGGASQAEAEVQSCETRHCPYNGTT